MRRNIESSQPEWLHSAIHSADKAVRWGTKYCKKCRGNQEAIKLIGLWAGRCDDDIRCNRCLSLIRKNNRAYNDEFNVALSIIDADGHKIINFDSYSSLTPKLSPPFYHLDCWAKNSPKLRKIHESEYHYKWGGGMMRPLLWEVWECPGCLEEVAIWYPLKIDSFIENDTDYFTSDEIAHIFGEDRRAVNKAAINLLIEDSGIDETYNIHQYQDGFRMPRADVAQLIFFMKGNKAKKLANQAVSYYKKIWKRDYSVVNLLSNLMQFEHNFP